MNMIQAELDKNKLMYYGIVIIIFIATMLRIYFYIFHKDLWLDEAMVALAIHDGSWIDIIRGKLNFTQSCPFGISLINKILSIITGYSEHVLYFLPTVMGICSVYVIVRGAYKFDGYVYAFISCTLICICNIAIYYSSEFKQYIYEMFFSAIMIRIVLEDLQSSNEDAFISFKYPLLMSFALLFSSASIFISAGIGATIAIRLLSRHQGILPTLKVLLSRYWPFLVFSCIYYFLYLKNGASEGMYRYWQKYFFPTTLAAWPEYLRTVLIPVAKGLFDVGGLTDFFFKFMICTSLIGAIRLWVKNRYAFCVLVFPLGFALLAAFRFYPPGHGGMIGARLSLWALPLFILLAAQGVLPIVKWVLDRCNPYITGILVSVVVCCVAYVNFQTAKNGIVRQQIHSLITTVANDYNNETDIVILYSSTYAAFRYYQIVDCLNMSYKIMKNNQIDEPNVNMANVLPNDFIQNKKRAFILYSHYNQKHSIKIKEYLISQGYNVEIIKEYGAELQKVDLMVNKF